MCQQLYTNIRTNSAAANWSETCKKKLSLGIRTHKRPVRSGTVLREHYGWTFKTYKTRCQHGHGSFQCQDGARMLRRSYRTLRSTEKSSPPADREDAMFKNQIDYILINSRYSNAFSSVNTNPGITIWWRVFLNYGWRRYIREWGIATICEK